MKLWGGRFDGQTSELMEQFNASIGFDWRLYEADIEASVAWAEALADAGVLSTDERDSIQSGLGQVLDEFASGQFELRRSDEDIHTAVERRLTELIGAHAGKLHTGRSRNDQVATDLRIYVRMAIHRIDELLCELQRMLIVQAQAAGDAVMPGYTHLQRAQPVPAAHWLLSHFWPLQRDRERLQNCRRGLNVLPLGAAALAGSGMSIDRALLARTLGFDDITANSMDAVADRDFVAEFLFAGALLGVHISRLAEDLVLYTSAEFGFVTLDDAYATGSSLMPHKKNPDSMELARGKSGRLVGNLVRLLTVLKGLPTTYNKDLQEDKEALFDSVDTLLLTLPVVAGAVGTLTLHTQRMRAALDDNMLATDVADELVRLGVPFRDAHTTVGKLVRDAENAGVALRDLGQDRVRAAHAGLAERWVELFDTRRSLEHRSVAGGTAAAAIAAQIAAAEKLVVPCQ